MQNSFPVDFSQHLRPVNLGQHSGGNATLAYVQLMEQMLSARRKHVCLTAREGEVCHVNMGINNHRITKSVFSAI
jgi:hypothetical protein